MDTAPFYSALAGFEPFDFLLLMMTPIPVIITNPPMMTLEKGHGHNAVDMVSRPSIISKIASFIVHLLYGTAKTSAV